MRKTIVRAITSSTIKSANVAFVEGKPVITENAPLTVMGSIKPEKAIKEVRKTYGESAQIAAIETADSFYEISVEDFIKYAKKIEPK